MTREQQNEKSRNKILQAAINEYGSKSYGETSINTICSQNGISKGLIYHYFDKVDNLFLACVNECFTKMYEHLQANVSIYKDDFKATIQSILTARYTFFSENPLLRNIFSVAMFQAPQHLQSKINEYHIKIEKFNKDFILSFISLYELRDTISQDNAVTYITFFVDFYISYFNSSSMTNLSPNEKFVISEKYIAKALDMLLYGIIKQEEN